MTRQGNTQSGRSSTHTSDVLLHHGDLKLQIVNRTRETLAFAVAVRRLVRLLIARGLLHEISSELASEAETTHFAVEFACLEERLQLANERAIAARQSRIAGQNENQKPSRSRFWRTVLMLVMWVLQRFTTVCRLFCSTRLW